MKNNKGFTLVELLAVILILAIIGAISTISINKVRKQTEEQNKKNIIREIFSGAKKYVADNPSVIADDTEIEVNSLVTNGYVSFDTDKYSDIYNDKVSVKTCDDNNVRLKYSINEYNDCGCESQGNGNNDLCRK